MPDYIQIEFGGVTTEQSERLIAQLSNEGFDGFEEYEEGLKAFIQASDYDESIVNDIASMAGAQFSKTIIAETNWNERWESSFEPVIVNDLVAVRAHFHEPISSVKHEIIITPKMSFGTGHHATTYMMMEEMGNIDFIGKTVFDFGTGTGVLAILAEKSGAIAIAATDIDEWSIENAEENCNRNGCTKITIEKAGSAMMPTQYDIILANINKNVILDNMETLAAELKREGILLLSGLLTTDKEDILQSAAKYGLRLQKRAEKGNWLSLRLSY